MRLWLVILGVLWNGPTPASVSPKVADKVLKTSVVLRMKSKLHKGKRALFGCSGTYVAPTLILTAAHCVQDDVEFIWARDVYQTVGYPVLFRIKWPTHDLAILEAPYPHVYAQLGKEPKVGEEVINVGSPMIFEFVVSEGIVAALNWTEKGLGAHYIITTAMINSGSSGGGAFNRKGELIGVNTMHMGPFGWTGITLAVSLEDTRQILQFCNKFIGD